MDTLDYIVKKYNIDVTQKSPFFVPIDRWKDFPTIFNELGFKVGAEIGVYKGEYTKVLCDAGLKIYGIDIWKKYGDYDDYKDQQHLTSAEDETRERLKDTKNVVLLKGWSQDVVNQFEDESLDFVFIDGNHDFRHATDDIDDWSKKVRKGGIVSGHDYVRMTGNAKMHVKDVVPGYANAYHIHPWFVITGSKYKGWFWVK
jgi:hypothetical protein